MAGYLGPKAIQYNVDNSNVTNDSNVGGDLTVGGNLLVGTTDTDPANSNVNGTAIGAANYLSMTRTNGASMILNRKSSDGDIALFRKDGSTVGSIGTNTGDLYIHSTDSDHVGLRFGNGRLQPTDNTGTVADDEVDIGFSSSRFKDLHLSGGVVFGTGGPSPITSNTLDDYEEGDWTPGVSTGTISAPYAKYTKIGRSVTVSAHIRSISDRASSLPFEITNLPFTSHGTSKAVGSVMMRFQGNTALTASYITSNTTGVVFYGVHTNTWAVALHSDWNHQDAEAHFTVTYFTDE